MAETEKLFVGNAKYRELSFGRITALGFSKDDLEKLTNNLNTNGWVNVDIKESREGAPYMEINTYGQEGTTSTKETKKVDNAEDGDDLPF